jgi:hypothetical protein
MRSEQFAPGVLRSFLVRRRVATMEELKDTLGTAVDMTVFRKLRALGYHSSYSHRGKFYTLAEVAQFSAEGLWRCRDAHFSHFGSLLDTVEQFVRRAPEGYRSAELRTALGVEVKEPLLTLVRRGRVAREVVDEQYLYCAPNRERRRDQLRVRQERTAGGPGRGRAADDETKAAVVLFLSTLNERQRRLYAGLEALRVGRGGDQWIAERTGLDVHTVARGRRELLERDRQIEAIRAPGGGRLRVEKKRRRSWRPSTPSSSPKPPGTR